MLVGRLDPRSHSGKVALKFTLIALARRRFLQVVGNCGVRVLRLLDTLGALLVDDRALDHERRRGDAEDEPGGPEQASRRRSARSTLDGAADGLTKRGFGDTGDDGRGDRRTG